MAVSITPHLWYAEKALEAARFYASITPNSRVDRVTTMPVDSPAGPPGSVTVVELTLAGHRSSPCPPGRWTRSITRSRSCSAATRRRRSTGCGTPSSTAGRPSGVGWLRDRYGVCWQVVPRRLGELMAGPDRTKAARVATTMLGMVKIDLGALEAA